MLELNFLPTGLYFIVLPPDHTHRCYKAFPLALDLMLESTEARAIALTFFFYFPQACYTRKPNLAARNPLRPRQSGLIFTTR